MLIEELLEEAVSKGASDIHISSNLPPVFRIDGKLIRTSLPPLTSDNVETLVFPILNNEQRRKLEQDWELDMSYGIHGIGRFRVNVYKNRGTYAAAFRTINTEVPSFETLGLPEIVRKITEKPRGLILVTGPTGSGKSTTLASMIDYINENRNEHILTIEDPIEFLHKSKKSVVHQRELGQDTRSFSNALRAALREDPDIILVGELRDLETISLAITAAETGHLVMGTLHTSSASQTVDRIVDVFPEAQQQQIRIQLSTVLQAVISQLLIPRCDKPGRVAVFEIMVNTPSIAALIRDNKTFRIGSDIQTGAKYGMVSLDACLLEKYDLGLISQEEVITKAQDPSTAMLKIQELDAIRAMKNAQ